MTAGGIGQIEADQFARRNGLPNSHVQDFALMPHDSGRANRLEHVCYFAQESLSDMLRRGIQSIPTATLNPMRNSAFLSPPTIPRSFHQKSPVTKGTALRFDSPVSHASKSVARTNNEISSGNMRGTMDIETAKFGRGHSRRMNITSLGDEIDELLQNQLHHTEQHPECPGSYELTHEIMHNSSESIFVCTLNCECDMPSVQMHTPNVSLDRPDTRTQMPLLMDKILGPNDSSDRLDTRAKRLS